jgi:hypothetical protein
MLNSLLWIVTNTKLQKLEFIISDRGGICPKDASKMVHVFIEHSDVVVENESA